MSQPELRTQRELEQDAIRRMVTYTDRVTWFGPNSAAAAIARMVGGQTARAYSLYRALVRRVTLLASSGDFTTQLAEELGARRLGAQRAKVLVVVTPRNAAVTNITIGATDLLEVDDSTEFLATRSIRIRSEDGTATEVATIIAVTSGTGPNGGDELEVASLANAYSFATEDVRVLLRHTIPANTTLNSTAGARFQTVQELLIGDLNPVLDGESSFLGLSDKVYAECTERGSVGIIDAGAILDFAPSIDQVNQVFNPEASQGGGDVESDFDLKYRASNGPAIASMETPQWVESLCQRGNSDALRAVVTSSILPSTMAIKVLARNGGALSTADKAALRTYLQDRVRSMLSIAIEDVTLTAIEVTAQITLDPDAELRTVWREAASRLAAHLDFRKWTFGSDVDSADLLTIVNTTPGVATLDVSGFLPATLVTVGDESLPTLTRLTLTDTTTTDTVGAGLTVQF